MRPGRARLISPLGLLLTAALSDVPAQVTQDAPAVRPEAIVDLRTVEGVRLVKGEWRYSDAKIVEVDHRGPGPDLKPSGPPNRTHDIAPKAGGSDFDDSKWEIIDPTALDGRRSTGRMCFDWYRIKITLPERVGGFEVAGSTVVFEIVIDDYAEIWVDGKLPLVLGQAGGPAVKGYNAPNRVVVARNARPGQTMQLAVFGMNGPISNPPGNFIWVRSATLDFYKADPPGRAREVDTVVTRLDKAIDDIVPKDARIEKLAGGFLFTEGPVWAGDGSRRSATRSRRSSAIPTAT